MLKQFIAVFILCVLMSGSQIQRVDAQQPNNRQFEQVSITEGVGIDVIEIGKSTTDSVIASYGKRFTLEKHNDYSSELVYANLGLSFYSCAKDQEKKIFLIEVLEGSTSKGISVGSTLEDVLNIYGEPDEVDRTAEPFVYQYKGIQFYVETAFSKKSAEENSPLPVEMKVVEIDIVPNDKSSNFCDGI